MSRHAQGVHVGDQPAGQSVTPGSAPTFAGLILTSDTWANRALYQNSGEFYYASDYGTGGALVRYNGARWKPANGVANWASADSVSGNIGNAETIVFQYLIPIAAWQTADKLKLRFTMSKSGTTDAGIFRIRIGAAGTTADTQVSNITTMVATTNRTSAGEIDYRLASATSVQQLANSGSVAVSAVYGTGTAAAFAAPISVTSAAANALYFSVGILSSSTNDTVALQDAQLQLVASAN